MMPCSLMAGEKTEVTASQDDSSDIDDIEEDDAEIDDDNDDKEWTNESSDMRLLDRTNVLTTRQVLPLYVNL